MIKCANTKLRNHISSQASAYCIQMTIFLLVTAINGAYCLVDKTDLISFYKKNIVINRWSILSKNRKRSLLRMQCRLTNWQYVHAKKFGKYFAFSELVRINPVLS